MATRLRASHQKKQNDSGLSSASVRSRSANRERIDALKKGQRRISSRRSNKSDQDKKKYDDSGRSVAGSSSSTSRLRRASSLSKSLEHNNPNGDETCYNVDNDRDDENKSPPEEPLSATSAFLVFLLICAIAGYREYRRVNRTPSDIHQLSITTGASNNQHQLRGGNKADTVPPAPMAMIDQLANAARSALKRNSILSPKEDTALEYETVGDETTRYHVIFSTDCSPYQHWQSYLVYYSAMRVRQPGHVTRIASGCSETEAKDMNKWFDENVAGLSKRFHLHLTPHFSSVTNADGQSVGDYKFFNKPFGLKHWMEQGNDMDMNTMQEDVVILIDPDMSFLRPITRYFDKPREVLIGKRRQDHTLGSKVQHGLPFAQTYGLGAGWQRFELLDIVGADSNSPALAVTQPEANMYFPAGPPYIATVKDMYQIALKWTEFVPRVHTQYPHLLAEMYAYCIAAAHLGLRHQLINSLMISNTQENPEGEGWGLLDEIPTEDMCDFAAHPQHDVYPVPSVVHLCQRYSMGKEWFFGKRKVPHDIYSCEKPLLELPPSDLATRFNYRQPPNQHEPKEITLAQARRETFMLCFLHTLLNDAATHYKRKACPAGTGNFEKTLRMTNLFLNKN